MNNPIEQPFPDDSIQQVHDFARDLAYGAVNRDWDTKFYYYNRTGWNNDPRFAHERNANAKLLKDKWGINVSDKAPTLPLLASYGYVTPTSTYPGPHDLMITEYLLSPAAFALLSRPVVPPQIFISYRRNEVSSTFALLIEARLKLVGVENPFIDKSIQAGEDWHNRLHDSITTAKYVVVLISRNTFESDWVRQEIAWAQENGCTIISIWHQGMRIDDKPAGCPEILYQRQAIRVTGESARDYEAAVNELLNALGYRTY